MQCGYCGLEMVVRREKHSYKECGLQGVTLEAIEVARCHRCGSYRLNIPNLDLLHRAIAEYLLAKTARLTGPEVRYLRGCLGLQGTELARRMGVAIETVSRWEQGACTIGPQADRLLRLMIAQALMIPYPLEILERIGACRGGETGISLGLRGESWIVNG